MPLAKIHVVEGRYDPARICQGIRGRKYLLRIIHIDRIQWRLVL
jgi:hypothetical protein